MDSRRRAGGRPGRQERTRVVLRFAPGVQEGREVDPGSTTPKPTVGAPVLGAPTGMATGQPALAPASARPITSGRTNSKARWVTVLLGVALGWVVASLFLMLLGLVGKSAPIHLVIATVLGVAAGVVFVVRRERTRQSVKP